MKMLSMHRPRPRVTGNKISYVDNVDDIGFDRDSHGLEIVGGSDFDFGGTVFGSLFAGAAKQRFGDANLRNITSAIFGGNVDWNITTLTTLNANATQSVQETTSGNAAGFLSSSAGIRADHELLRNMLLNVNLGVTQAKYKGIYRHEYTYQGGLGMKFNLMMERPREWISGWCSVKIFQSNSFSDTGCCGFRGADVSSI